MIGSLLIIISSKKLPSSCSTTETIDFLSSKREDSKCLLSRDKLKASISKAVGVVLLYMG